MHGQFIQRPLVLREERVEPRTPLAVEHARELPELVRHAVVELVDEPLRIREIRLLVVVVVQTVVPGLEIVRTGDIREVRVPRVRYDPAGRGEERAAAQRAARSITESRNVSELFPDLDEVERRASGRRVAAPARA